MADWLKILVSALAGMLMAATLEPLKFAINARLRKRQLRRAIYEELATLYDFIRGMQHPDAVVGALLYDAAILRQNKTSMSHEAFVKDRLSLWSFDVFDHYYKTEPHSFHQLREARVLKNIVDQTKRWLSSSDQPMKKLENLLHWMDCIDGSLSSGEIDRDVFGAAQKAVRKDHFGISVPAFVAPLLSAYYGWRGKRRVIHIWSRSPKGKRSKQEPV